MNRKKRHRKATSALTNKCFFWCFRSATTYKIVWEQISGIWNILKIEVFRCWPWITMSLLWVWRGTYAACHSSSPPSLVSCPLSTVNSHARTYISIQRKKERNSVLRCLEWYILMFTVSTAWAHVHDNTMSKRMNYLFKGSLQLIKSTSSLNTPCQSSNTSAVLSVYLSI